MRHTIATNAAFQEPLSDIFDRLTVVFRTAVHYMIPDTMVHQGSTIFSLNFSITKRTEELCGFAKFTESFQTRVMIHIHLQSI